MRRGDSGRGRSRETLHIWASAARRIAGGAGREAAPGAPRRRRQARGAEEVRAEGSAGVPR